MQPIVTTAAGEAFAPVRVLVAHGDELIAAGISRICSAQPDFATVQARSDDPAPEWHGGSHAGHIVLADYASAPRWLSMPQRRGDGSDASRWGPARVIVITSALGEWQVRSALELGVHGYLHQACSEQELCAGIRTVSRGGRYVTQAAAQCVANALTQEALTQRELEVLHLIGLGLCNKSVAQQLSVAPGTVKTHVKAILAKLGAASRTQAVVTAARRGLLPQASASMATTTTAAVVQRGAPAARAAAFSLPLRRTSPLHR